MTDQWLLRISGVRELTGLSESSIRRLVAAGDFPSPSKIGGATCWHRDDIHRWSKEQFDRYQQQASKA